MLSAAVVVAVKDFQAEPGDITWLDEARTGGKTRLKVDGTSYEITVQAVKVLDSRPS